MRRGVGRLAGAYDHDLLGNRSERNQVGEALHGHRIAVIQIAGNGFRQGADYGHRPEVSVRDLIQNIKKRTRGYCSIAGAASGFTAFGGRRIVGGAWGALSPGRIDGKSKAGTYFFQY